MKNKLNIPANLWISQNFQLTYFIDLFGLSDLLMSKNNFPSSSGGKESACNAGGPGSILGLGRSSGEGNGYPLQYSCLENSMDRDAWGRLQSMGSQRVRHDWVTNNRTVMTSSLFHMLCTANLYLVRSAEIQMPLSVKLYFEKSEDKNMTVTLG